MFPAEPIPDAIGSYKILRRLPSSGAAEVYLARNQGPMGFERDCELKLLPDTSEGDRGVAEELAREAAICAKMNHSAVVRVFDFFAHRNKLVLVLEHVQGTTLAEIVQHVADKRQKLGDAAIFYIGARIAGALADAHAATDEHGEPTPIVHRNLSPESILVAVDGEVRLSGFGVGKIVGRTPDTQIGRIKGTPGYMAPEQARGEPVTTKADVYGVGLLLWSLLAARRPPTEGSSPPPMASLRPDLPREVAALIDASLEQAASARKISAREIEQWLTKAAPTARAKGELREKVAALRAEVGGREGDLTPPPSSRRRIATAGSPYQGVRFGPPPGSRAAARIAIVPPSPESTAAPSTSGARPIPSAEPPSDAASSGPERVRNLPPPPLPEGRAPIGATPTMGPPSLQFTAPQPPALVEAAPPPIEAAPHVDPAPLAFEPPPVSLHFGAPPLPLSSPPPSFGAPPHSPHAAFAPATRPSDGPPPRRSRLPSLLIGGRTISPAGTIILSALTASVTVTLLVSLYVALRRDKTTPTSNTASSSAASASAPPQTAAAPPTASALAPGGASSANPAELPYGYGYLTVVSPAAANVFLSGKLAGSVNTPLKVRCGRWFVRLASPRDGQYPDWVSRGETVVVPCQESTRLEVGRGR